MLAASQNVSQYFTLDASCYYGCQQTGAGNCEEICQIPAYSVSVATPGTTGAPGTVPKSAGQLIAGVDNKILLIAAAIIAGVLIVR